MIDQIVSISFTLFLLMDSIGNIPVYILILRGLEPKRRRIVILRELSIALFTILLFAFFGERFLKVLEISLESIFLAGGIILFIMGLKMIFPENGSLSDAFKADGEPLIFPLAIPLIAGPSVLAAVMIYSFQLESQSLLYIAIILAWIASTFILYLSNFLQQLLGQRGVKALERLMGLLLILLSINMFLNGIRMFQRSL